MRTAISAGPRAQLGADERRRELLAAAAVWLMTRGAERLVDLAAGVKALLFFCRQRRGGRCGVQVSLARSIAREALTRAARADRRPSCRQRDERGFARQSPPPRSSLPPASTRDGPGRRRAEMPASFRDRRVRPAPLRQPAARRGAAPRPPPPPPGIAAPSSAASAPDISAARCHRWTGAVRHEREHLLQPRILPPAHDGRRGHGDRRVQLRRRGPARGAVPSTAPFRCRRRRSARRRRSPGQCHAFQGVRQSRPRALPRAAPRETPPAALALPSRHRRAGARHFPGSSRARTSASAPRAAALRAARRAAGSVSAFFTSSMSSRSSPSSVHSACSRTRVVR